MKLGVVFQDLVQVADQQSIVSWCQDFSAARMTFEEANDFLGVDLIENNHGDYLELAFLTSQIAAFRVFMEQLGLIPACTAAVGLGEYAALVCSGAIEFRNALQLVQSQYGIASIQIMDKPLWPVAKRLKQEVDFVLEIGIWDRGAIELTRDALFQCKQLLGSRDPRLQYTVTSRCLAAAVSAENKNWNSVEYVEGVIKPYELVQMVNRELEERGSFPLTEQIRHSMEMLHSVFETKRVDHEERKRLLDRYLVEPELRAYAQTKYGF